MAEFLLPDFKICEETQNADIRKLLKIIKPSWDSEKIQIKMMLGGYSSRVFRIYLDNDPKDSVVVRVRHMLLKAAKETVENKLELTALQHLSRIGHFSKVYAIFGNGYCYGYIEGTPMINIRERTGYVDNQMLSAMATEMAFIHSIKLKHVDYSDKNAFRFLVDLVKALDPEISMEKGLTKKRLEKELQLILNHIRTKNYRTVLCHGDPHPGNYVWNTEEGKVTFVDWELADIGYQWAEIAQLFLTMKMVEIAYSREGAKPVIEDGFQRKFVHYYIEAWKKHQKDDTDVTNEEVAQWMTEIETFLLVPQFLFVIFGAVYPDVFLEFAGDMSVYDEVVIKDYRNLKRRIFGKESFEDE